MKPIPRDELVYGFTPEPGLVAIEHAPGEDADAMTLFLRPTASSPPARSPSPPSCG
jgi:hypothetical protein